MRNSIIKTLKIILLLISILSLFTILGIYNSIENTEITFEILWPSMRKMALLLIAQIIIILKFYFFYDASTQGIIDYRLKNNIGKFLFCFIFSFLFTILIPIAVYYYIYLANYHSPVISEATDKIYNTMSLIWLIVEVPVLYIFLTKKDMPKG